LHRPQGNKQELYSDGRYRGAWAMKKAYGSSSKIKADAPPPPLQMAAAPSLALF
jgi:hypothetical protein